MTPHTHSADTGWRTVAAHTARLGLSTYALAGTLTLFHTALATNPPIPVPIYPQTYLHGDLGLVAATSVLCGLTWLTHRATRPCATRAGAGLLLIATAAYACYLTAPTNSPDTSGGRELAAVYAPILLAGTALSALVGAGRPTTVEAGEVASRRHRASVRVGLRVIAYAITLTLWISLIPTPTDHRVTAAALGISLWSASTTAGGGLTTHHPARQRATALVGALLLPATLSQVLAVDLSGHASLARLTAIVALALTVALVAASWWLSRGDDAHPAGLDALAGGQGSPINNAGRAASEPEDRLGQSGDELSNQVYE